MHGCLGVNSEGRGGDLALMWVEKLDVKLINFSQDHIHAMVKELDEPHYLFTGLYGQPEALHRVETWNLLCRFCQWVSVG